LYKWNLKLNSDLTEVGTENIADESFVDGRDIDFVFVQEAFDADGAELGGRKGREISLKASDWSSACGDYAYISWRHGQGSYDASY